MGWGSGERPGWRTSPADDEWNRASALCAAQLPLVWLAWWYCAVAGRDDYGRTGGFLGIVCVPLVLPVLGVLHATVQIMPAAVLADLGPVRRHGPRWARRAVASALVGSGWAVVGHLLWDWPVTVTLPWFAAVGILPVLGLALLRRREWGGRGVWLRAAGACVVLFAAAGTGVAALADEYEPPKLSTGRLTGDWHGDGGALLRLEPGGRAELTRVPALPGVGASRPDAGARSDYTRCDGTGAWTRHPGGRGGEDRDAVLVRVDGDCGLETYWTIGGTERDPELFALFGDPDVGEPLVLARGSAGQP
ncbi:hypothetical protein [Streptomyces sp. NPDC047725]|uniref:hypothetical protein n=1 Tax=Streptomyces sp. NPDC047725 TaxID=3365487 RepID=UPI0037187A7E